MTDTYPIDISFTVPMVHRLRFTENVLTRDLQTLVDLLEPAPGGPARAIVIAEHHSGKELARVLHRDAVEVVDTIDIHGGEAIKNDPARLMPILQAILDGKIDRRSYVIAVGGGAMLDAVGFAVAVAHRGVRLVRLPTTTLSQADSGVGVKNAINFFGRKNWVGTFAVPWGVVNDHAMLLSLTDRDWRSGFSEAVKVSLLKDAFFFDTISRGANAIAARDWAVAGPVIRHAAQLHLRHITTGGDPFENEEARPLDFGHWAAHRLETMTGYLLRHGEAVAIGLAIDCTYSTMVHGMPPASAERIIQCLHEIGLPTTYPELANIDTLLGGLEEFRLHLGGRLTVTMLRDIGDPIDVHEIDQTAMREAVRRVAAERPSR